MKIIIEKQSELEWVPELVGTLRPDMDMKPIEGMLSGVTITCAAPLIISKPVMDAAGKPVLETFSIVFPTQ